MNHLILHELKEVDPRDVVIMFGDGTCHWEGEHVVKR